MSRLRAHELSVGYGDRPVLQGLNCELPPGRLTVVLGANGVGKTTLLKTLAGLLAPCSGAVLLDDRPLASWPLRARARLLAFVPQREGEPWPLRVRETVLLGRAPRRGWLRPYAAEDHRAVAASLAELGLTELAERTLDTLSGGELRRVMLARALAAQPRVLLADEPTAYLDLRYQVQILAALAALAARGLTVAVSLHELHLAARFGDRFLLLGRDGRILAQGDAEAVFQPELLTAAYGVPVEVDPHPRDGRPLVTPRPSTDGGGNDDVRGLP